MTYLGIFSGMGGGQIIFSAISSITIQLVGQKAALHLHNQAFANLMRAPMSFFDTTPIGRILNRFSRDQDVIDAALGDTFRTTAVLFTTAIFTFVMIAIISPWFLVPFAPIMFMYYHTQNMYRNCSREIKRLDAIARSPLYAHFSETLTGLSTIRAYQEEKRFISGNENKMDYNNRGICLIH
jgi:ABC-type multidrug transport system fused ATPase/permease subunit